VAVKQYVKKQFAEGYNGGNCIMFCTSGDKHDVDESLAWHHQQFLLVALLITAKVNSKLL